MDTTKDIIYRTFKLNDEDITDNITGGGATGTGVAGSVVDSFDLSDVDVVQFVEKRSQRRGSITGEVDEGVRRIRLSGTLYDLTRGLLYDRLFALRKAMNPILAQREEPLDHGYRPFFFSVPTFRTADYPTGFIDLQVKAMPRAFQQLTNRDQMGGEEGDALAVPWQATLVCADPAILSAETVDTVFTAQTAVTGVVVEADTELFTKTAHGLVAGDRITFLAKTGGTGITLGTAYFVIATGLTANDFKVSLTSGGAAINVTLDGTAISYVKSRTDTGDLVNRGNMLATLNMTLGVGASGGTIVAAIGDSTFTITVPASTGSRIIRFKGDDGIVTFDEDSVEVLQMSATVFDGDSTYPLIEEGTSPWSITWHGLVLEAGSHMWFYEQYA